MENNFNQVAGSADHAVAYIIDKICKHIIDCICLHKYCPSTLSTLSGSNEDEAIATSHKQRAAHDPL